MSARPGLFGRVATPWRFGCGLEGAQGLAGCG